MSTMDERGCVPALHVPAPPSRTRRAATSRVIPALIGVAVLSVASPAPAHATSAAHIAGPVDLRVQGSGQQECVERRMRSGESRAEAIAGCVRDAATPTTGPAITAPGGGLAPDGADDGDAGDDGEDGDGTSVGLLIAVGVGGALIGAGLALALRRRSTGSADAVAPAPARAGGATLPPAPAAPANAFGAPGSPLSPPAAGSDRSSGLVTTLIDLSDRVSSGALRAEIVTALARAGVHAVEPQPGEPFDAARMRGVGSAAAPDPSWIGRVAATERAGFVDGGHVVRLPEVIAYTAEG